MMHPEPPAPGEYVAGVFLHPNGFSTERNMVTSVMNALNLDTTDFRLRDRLIVAASPWLDRERADRDSPAQTPPAAAPAGPGDAGPDKDDAELRRLAWAASAGPWEYVHAGPDCEEPHTVMGAWYDGSRTSIAHTHWRRPNEEANFRFIAAARNALPGLLDRLADARGRLAAVLSDHGIAELVRRLAAAEASNARLAAEVGRLTKAARFVVAHECEQHPCPRCYDAAKVALKPVPPGPAAGAKGDTP
jgi:hypothetical protein